MDEGVRLLLTKCASFCLPPVPPTPARQKAIKRLLAVAEPTADDVQLIRTFLHDAESLGTAIRQLPEVATPTKLNRFLRRHVDTDDGALIATTNSNPKPCLSTARS